MKLLITSICLSLFVYSESMAQKDPKALKILDAMSARYKKVPAFNTSFKYIMENPEESIDEGFDGSVYVKGDLYKLLIEGQEIMFDGTDRWTYLKEDNEVNVATFDPEEEEISISNIFNIYKTGFKYLYLESKENGKVDVVDLVPEDLDETYYKIRMEISADTRDLLSFKIFDKSGSRFSYKIDKIVEDNSLTDKDFTFDISANPGVDVVDFR